MKAKTDIPLFVIAVILVFVAYSYFFTDNNSYIVSHENCGIYDGRRQCFNSWTDKIILDNGTVVKYKDIKSWSDFLNENGQSKPLIFANTGRVTSYMDTPIGYGEWQIGMNDSNHYIVTRNNICDFYCNYFKTEAEGS